MSTSMKLLGYGLAMMVGILVLPISLPIMIGSMVHQSRKEKRQLKAISVPGTPQSAVLGSPMMVPRCHYSHIPQANMYSGYVPQANMYSGYVPQGHGMAPVPRLTY